MTHRIKQATTALVAIAFLLIGTSAKAETALQLLDRAAENFRKAKSVSAAYTITDGTDSMRGSALLSGEKFQISTPEISIWYDGTTQWAFSAEMNEVNVSEPTPEEIQEVNPFVIINTFRQLYYATFSGKSKGNDRTITLKAKSKNIEISKATITINTSTLLPSEITLTPKNGNTMKIKINTIRIGNEVNQSVFQFNKSLFPGVEIVDLR